MKLLKSSRSHIGIRNISSFRTFVKDVKPRILPFVGVTFGLGIAAYAANVVHKLTPTLTAEAGKPTEKVSRSIRNESDTSGLKLTLYQYQTCPFCCKARTYLDYYGFSYDVVEVNSLWRTQIKWSKYKKVPILVCDGIGEEGYLQVNDSSVIISVLDSFLEERSPGLERIVSYYPPMEAKNARGKDVIEYPNKYFVMYGDKDITSSTPEQRKEERKWRKWADAHFVHLISPNIYRTRSEALEAFRYYDEAGEWEKHFSAFERQVVIQVGALAMFLIGKKLKKKYELKEDVRESLHDGCREWTAALGKKRPFMGGDRPNLADLAVYGVLHSTEGCRAFEEAMAVNPQLKAWYGRTQQAVQRHLGSQAR